MANNFPEYFKRFINRNLMNDSLRESTTKEPNNATTITDLMMLPVLVIVILIRLFERTFNKNNK
ncbi:MAG: hypothetical protein JJT76_14655 [Clostridiaceae bacterium]|nr:hypothetical protein [Clostridiaceae bacterium]